MLVCSLRNLRLVYFSIAFLLSGMQQSTFAQTATGPNGLPKEITGESYWMNKTLGRVLGEAETPTHIVGTIQAKHNPSAFSVPKDIASIEATRTHGMKMAVEEMLSWLNTSAKDYAVARLTTITGETFDSPMQWRTWYAKNAEFLEWSPKTGMLTIGTGVK